MILPIFYFFIFLDLLYKEEISFGLFGLHCQKRKVLDCCVSFVGCYFCKPAESESLNSNKDAFLCLGFFSFLVPELHTHPAPESGFN